MLLLGGSAWNAWLFISNVRKPWQAAEAFVYGFGLGMLPLVALALAAGFIRSRAALMLAAAAHIALVASAARLAFAGRSSTDAVALAVAPLASLLVVVPAAVLIGVTSRRLATRRGRVDDG